ncbi:MAG: bifunctional precorrin-2 dehydrogenase/sirohydrochlorin ferrochelatase [Labilithrix sp.]|nr:bifunctional precorrin-2 dehydrogenase/sirohydrochlorin ferrochelatase [Labilithrix sp.]
MTIGRRKGGSTEGTSGEQAGAEEDPAEARGPCDTGPAMSDAPPPQLFPLFLRLAGKDVLVVGAGAVAERKIQDLVESGAAVRVVALTATAAVERLAADGAIALSRRAFDESDVDGAWLVVAATTDPAVQARACSRAAAGRVLALAVDDPPNGSAYSASVIRRGPFTIAISSSGEAPALSRLLREVLEQALPADDWIEAARALRERWRRDGAPMASRFADLVRAFKARAD